MEQVVKPWWQSKTIWGILIAAVGFVISEVLKVPSVSLPENADFEQLKQYAEAVKASQGSITVIISQVVAAVGAVLGIYGRVVAESKIG
jgi:hypothetical protein